MTDKVNEPMAIYSLSGSSFDTNEHASLTKIFGSWLQSLLPDMHNPHSRLEDDKTMMHVVEITRKGIDNKKYSSLKDQLHFSKEDWMHIFDASESTLRRIDKKDVLDKKQSERLADLALLGDYGEEVFGSSDIFLDWLDTDIPSMGHIKPKSLLDTAQGISIIKTELGRIEHGITL